MQSAAPPASKFLSFAVALASAGLLSLGLQKGGPPLDEGMLLSGADLIQRGMKPGLDFNYTYGPTSLSTIAINEALLGPGVTAQRILGVGYRIAILLGLYALARPRGQNVALASISIGAILLASVTAGAYAWFGAIALLLASLSLFSRSFSAQRQGLFLWGSGLLGGLALGFRPDLGLAALLMLLPLFLLVSLRQKALFVVGVFLGLAPLASHVIGISPQALYQALVVEPRLMMPGRVLPIPWKEPKLVVFLLLTLIAKIAWLVSGTVRLRREPRSPEARTHMGIGLLSIALLPQVIQRADSWHIVYGAIVSVALLPALLAPTQEPIADRLRSLWKPVASPFFSVALLVISAPKILLSQPLSLSQGHRVQHGGRDFFLDSQEQARDAQGLLDDLGRLSKNGERIFIGPRDLRRTNYNDTYLYYLLPQLTPASYFTMLVPGLDRDRLAKEISSADWLALTSFYDDWNEPNASMSYASDELNLLVEERFCKVADHGSYQLLSRCDG